MEAEHPVQQAFGSPGGKSYLARRIAGMIPPHKVYVEPYAGGAAVYFKKQPSEKEILGDKDSEIAFAFRFLRDMTEEQFKGLKKFNWKVSRTTFKKVKGMKPKDDVERFRQFYYLKRASFGSASKKISQLLGTGFIINIDRLWKVHERLKRTAVCGGDAMMAIRKYDKPATFFYLDPPYPDRSFAGIENKYTTEDLNELVQSLKGIKGKFALSLASENTIPLPKNWHIKRVKVRRLGWHGGNFNQSYQYEIIATNYKPVAGKVKLQGQMHAKRAKRRSNGHGRHAVSRGISLLKN